MARLITCGFESQDVAVGSEHEMSAIIGGPSPGVPPDVHSGAGSLLCSGTIAAGTSEGGELYFPPRSTVYAQWTFRMATASPGLAMPLQLQLLNSGVVAASVDLTRTAGTVLAATVTANNGATSVGTFNTVYSVWQCVEVLYDSTPADGSEVLTVKLNGVVVATSSALTLTQKLVNQIRFVLTNNTGASNNTFSAYFDDIIVNDSSGFGENSWVNQQKIIVLNPDSAGDSNQFTVTIGGSTGAVNNFARLNGVNPNDASSNGSSFPGQRDSVNLIAASSVLSPMARIRCVSVGGRVRNSSSADSGEALRFELKVRAGAVPIQSGNVIPDNTAFVHNNGVTATYPLVSYVEPLFGMPWTLDTLDTMQAGYTLQTGPVVEGNRIDVSTMYVQVSYNEFFTEWGFSSNVNTGTTMTTSPPTDIPAGAFVVLAAVCTTVATAALTLTDPAGNTWTKNQKRSAGTGMEVAYWSSKLSAPITTSTVLTVTCAAAMSRKCLHAVAWDNPIFMPEIQTTMLDDTDTSLNGTTTTPPSVPALVFAVVGLGAANTVFTPGAGWNASLREQSSVGSTDRAVQILWRNGVAGTGYATVGTVNTAGQNVVGLGYGNLAHLPLGWVTKPLKVWTGSAWVTKPMTSRVGGSFIPKPVKVWTG